MPFNFCQYELVAATKAPATRPNCFARMLPFAMVKFEVDSGTTGRSVGSRAKSSNSTCQNVLHIAVIRKASHRSRFSAEFQGISLCITTFGNSRLC